MAPVSLAVQRWPAKAGTGKTALLLHGITGGGQNWWRLGPYLAERGYNVYAPDLRGHGRSERAQSYRYQDYVEDLDSLPKPFDVVIGHSLGTSIATKAAAQQGAAFARRVVLIEPIHLEGPEHAEALQQQYDELVDTDASIRAAHPKWDDRDVQAKLDMAQLASKDMVAKTFAQNDPMDMLSEQKTLQVPVLAICADLDVGSTFPAVDEEQLKANKMWETIRVAGAGHSVHRDDWPAFVSLLDAFLAK